MSFKRIKIDNKFIYFSVKVLKEQNKLSSQEISKFLIMDNASINKTHKVKLIEQNIKIKYLITLTTNQVWCWKHEILIQYLKILILLGSNL